MRRTAAACAFMSLCMTSAHAQTCGPAWSSAFEVKGFSGALWNLAELDPDGPGPQPRALYISGDLAGTPTGTLGPRVTRWDGHEFLDLPPFSHPMTDVEVFDFDGSGPRPPETIVVAGMGPWVLRDGNWVSVLQDLPLPPPHSEFLGLRITALAVLDEDGSGPQSPALYAAGHSGYQEPAPNWCTGSQHYIARHRAGAWEPVVVPPGAHFPTRGVFGFQPVRLSATSSAERLAVSIYTDWTPCYGPGGQWGAENTASLLNGSTLEQLAVCSYWATDPGPCFGYSGLATYDGDPYGVAEPTLYANAEVATGPNRPLATPPIWISQLHTADLDASGPGPELMYASGPAPVYM